MRQLLILVKQLAKPVASSDVADLGCGAAAACRLVEDKDAVEDFAADAADEAFGDQAPRHRWDGR
jgi:hypothetical protein